MSPDPRRTVLARASQIEQPFYTIGYLDRYLDVNVGSNALSLVFASLSNWICCLFLIVTLAPLIRQFFECLKAGIT